MVGLLGKPHICVYILYSPDMNDADIDTSGGTTHGQ